MQAVDKTGIAIYKWIPLVNPKAIKLRVSK